MGSLRSAVCAAAVTAGMGVFAAPAAAESPGAGTAAIRVSPSAVPAGGRVDLTVAGCPGTVATATSTAFATMARLTPPGPPGEGSGAVLSGPATVLRDSAEGTHTVYVTCGAKEPGRAGATIAARAPLTVRGPAEAAPPAAPDSRSAGPGGEPGAPVAPVSAGGGGSAPRDADGRVGPAEAYGLALAGGAVLTVGARAVHRRRTARAARPSRYPTAG
ncbi:hypothetical protein [Streptomyces sp. NPDC018031]|uniref:hypothetical protein n=1 Tax=Streptomyces sp. NPDC018031 TaxID=3365033 RepID=UPI0037AC512B